MDSATTSTTATSRPEASTRPPVRAAAASPNPEKKKNAAPEPKPDDFGVTVKGRFDPELRRFFVTILDTSSGSLIVQFPSQAAASYAQQLLKNAGQDEAAPEDSDKNAPSEPRLNQTT